MNILCSHILYQSDLRAAAENMCMRWKIQLPANAADIGVLDSETGEIIFGI
jgi:hypothetical protein